MESRVPAADQTARRGLVFLGTSPRSSLLRSLSLFFLSRHLSRQCLGVNILFSGGRRRRCYV